MYFSNMKKMQSDGQGGGEMQSGGHIKLIPVEMLIL